jgi:lysophospholipase L1-like esterase
VDYLPLVGDDTVPAPGNGLGAGEIDAFRRIGARLAEAFAAAATRTGADLVRASALGAGHALGSPEPWVTGFRPSLRSAPFHPNARGMQAVADALYELVAH